MKMAEYGLPLHVQTADEFIMDDHYHDNGMTSPHDLGPWMEDQSDGGGKFRLKRRRRCGQCGPCQVKENCGKCQYCVRKDVLKQACIYRKCIYLRKPVPRFRPDAAGSSSSGSGGGGSSSNNSSVIGGGGSIGGGSSGGILNKASPQKISTTPSTVTNHHGAHPTPSPFNPSAAAAAAAAVQSAEMSSCRLGQSSFGLTVNNGVIDPLRGSALDQHRSALFDATGMLDPARTAYLSSARGLDPGRSPALDLGRNTSTADSGLGTSGSSLPTSPANQTKDRPTPMEQFRSPMEQWGAMPYAFPRNPWAHPALQPNPAAYGFQSSAAPFPSPFGSSCRLGMPDPTGHLTAPPQPAFHHNMPFSRPDFAATANFRGAGPPMQATMTPPFYPPPPHIPSSLPNFPSFNQLPSSAGPHASYPMPHPPMYPGNFYTSFRPHNEPQIYHAHFQPPELPFLRPGGLGGSFPPFWSKDLKLGIGDKGGKGGHDCEDDDDLHKKFSIFRIPKCKCKAGLTSEKLSEVLDLAEFGSKKTPSVCRHILEASGGKSKDVRLYADDARRPRSAHEVRVDEDLQQEMKRVSGRGECGVISIDDFKLQAYIRSDGFNNLEIEIDEPLNPINIALNSPHHRHPSSCGDSSSQSRTAQQETATQGSCADQDDVDVVEKDSVSKTKRKKGSRCGDSERDISDQRKDNSRNDDDSQGGGVVCVAGGGGARTLLQDLDVCVMQEGGEGEGLTVRVEVAGSKVHLEEVMVDDNILSLSRDPDDLLNFLAEHPSPSAMSPLSSDSYVTTVPRS